MNNAEFYTNFWHHIIIRKSVVFRRQLHPKSNDFNISEYMAAYVFFKLLNWICQLVNVEEFPTNRRVT